MPRVTQAKKAGTTENPPPVKVKGCSDEDYLIFFHESTVKGLRKYLRENGLSVSGKKADLVLRVLQFISKRHHYDDSEDEDDDNNTSDGQPSSREVREDDNDTGSDDEYHDFPAFLEQHLSDFCDRIAPPLAAGVIEQYQQKLQKVIGERGKLPDELVQLYQFCGGCECPDSLDIRPLTTEPSEMLLDGQTWILIGCCAMELLVVVNTNSKSRTFGHVRLQERELADKISDETFPTVSKFMVEMWKRFY